jgi:hypothetical protein
MGKLDKHVSGLYSTLITSDHGFHQINNKQPVLNKKDINKFLIDINSLIGHIMFYYIKFIN